MSRLEMIKTLIQAQMKMKFVLQQMYNSLMMLVNNLNQTEKLKSYNHTCKRMFRLKMMPMKTLIQARMKMKFALQQMYNSLMIKNLILKWIKMNLELINQTYNYQLKLKLKL